MTSAPRPEGAIAAYDEAEKGTLELHSGPITVADLGLVNEKVDEKPELPTPISTEVVPSSDATAIVTKPHAKRKKVSKWILWTLWFNTYRCVSVTSASRISNSASGFNC
jgi:hypothetical protein